MRFNRLRLTGFKSFVEPTELLIEQGLTGIVGPNGCGKSNLVEALRWVMGESSAKQMRGGEMDDVIFGGTRERPARNMAEVILGLDNADRTAPAVFNHMDDLDVSRRIERGSGSTYRVNGKEVRARDVQLLFADAATGPRSNALVSQGRIGNIISAKPTARRILLEEAAGITGLHSRRHEAELRLRGAETNLVRLEDVLGTLEVQHKTLKKQARQASRYSNLSGHIRHAEATLFHLRWLAAQADLGQGREHQKEGEAAVARLTGEAADASRLQVEFTAKLPPLRQAEAEAAAELQRVTIAREGLDAEERRIDEAQAECRARLAQIATDIERESALAADAKAAIRMLEAESGEIDEAREGQDTARQTAESKLTAIRQIVAELENRHAELTDKIAADEARRNTLARRIEEQNRRRQMLADRLAENTSQRKAIEASAIGPGEMGEAENNLANAMETAVQARETAETAGNKRAEVDTSVREAVAGLHEVQSAFGRLEAEAKALADMLEAGESESWPPLIDSVSVDPGFEVALGAALGEDLSAPADEPAPVRWRTLAPLGVPQALPDGCEPLSSHVKGPAALTRRLSQIGVAVDEEAGAALSASLKPGQRIVSQDGGLWRWDGFTVSAGAPTAAAARLEQRNRLAEIRVEMSDSESAVSAAATKVEEAESRAAAAVEAETKARQDAFAADTAHNRARDALSEIKEKASQIDSRLAGLAEAAESIEADRAESEASAKEATEGLSALPDPTEARENISALRAELAERRAEQVESQSAHDSLERLASDRQNRQNAIVRELTSWRERGDGATRRLEQLAERKKTIESEAEKLAAKPSEIVEKRQALLSLIEAAENNRNTAADHLAQAETRLAEADQVLRQAENTLSAARENRVRAEGTVEQAEQATQSLRERIIERLDCGPEELESIAELKEGVELPDLDSVEKRVERLQRERDTMGPVNLRAEVEANELSEQIETLETEKGDLVKAIEKLRRGISELNREGRQRLLASFEEVDGHFRALFVRLFGGGRAHLALTESDDPLEAGLEIMASPPGKRLQVLSLLSGGEQALTALALMFAVFLTNPAPVCVLDEVDAPLDDANVDRFCTLVEEMARAGKTNFLVITHHRMTMARMDRLFGVTMSERGVSQLVSVDLQQAVELREIA
ncbi:MAG: chromosome segregation protein SMC [Rhodospirillales bacterium]|nr:chromosome segregation protein SMC [Rhodospirillales bacterium]